MSQNSASKLQILITGAAGRIGSYLCEHLPERYQLRLGIGPGAEPLAAEPASRHQRVALELADQQGLYAACRGCDSVVHLAGQASPTATWADLLPNNIVGTYNLFLCALAAGCRQVIFASSIHAVSGYPVGRQVRPEDPVSPGDLYGVSKCFGEALGSYFATQHGLSVICIRIGACRPQANARLIKALPIADAFVSEGDLCHLIDRCLQMDRPGFAIVHGLSDNFYNRLDITSTRQDTGYAPHDDFTALHPDTCDLHLAERMQLHDERHSNGPSSIEADLQRLRANEA